jgi:hypothetical protein
MLADAVNKLRQLVLEGVRFSAWHPEVAQLCACIHCNMKRRNLSRGGIAYPTSPLRAPRYGGSATDVQSHNTYSTSLRSCAIVPPKVERESIPLAYRGVRATPWIVATDGWTLAGLWFLTVGAGFLALGAGGYQAPAVYAAARTHPCSTLTDCGTYLKCSGSAGRYCGRPLGR